MRFAAIAFGLSLTLHAAAQGPSGSPPASSQDIERLISRHVANARAYDAAFRNLTAEETKVSEEFERDGRLKQRRVTVSDLVVYQSQRDQVDTTEYRDIRSVDSASTWSTSPLGFVVYSRRRVFRDFGSRIPMRIPWNASYGNHH